MPPRSLAGSLLSTRTFRMLLPGAFLSALVFGCTPLESYLLLSLSLTTYSTPLRRALSRNGSCSTTLSFRSLLRFAAFIRAKMLFSDTYSTTLKCRQGWRWGRKHLETTPNKGGVVSESDVWETGIGYEVFCIIRSFPFRGHSPIAWWIDLSGSAPVS